MLSIHGRWTDDRSLAREQNAMRCNLIAKTTCFARFQQVAPPPSIRQRDAVQRSSCAAAREQQCS
jgi:hypothetical protein